MFVSYVVESFTRTNIQNDVSWNKNIDWMDLMWLKIQEALKEIVSKLTLCHGASSGHVQYHYN